MSLPIAGTPTPTANPPASPLSPELRAELDGIIGSNDLVLFMKGTPEQPQCGFSARAAAALRETGRPFHAVNVFEFGPDPFTTIRALAAYADFPTLPQVWVKGELIGGSDIAAAMVASGELQEMLSA